MPYKQFESVDLGEGVSGVIIDAFANPTPGSSYIVEVFLVPGSMGDGLVDMVERPDGTLVLCDPQELETIKRQRPNVDEEAGAR